ncbi:PorT family protein [Chryseobacterium sp. RP-3-3]|uniref:PorT family protein n=1 Tax=Chryseobacterium antibioticum TaxID=2728847 RepID=A0A7Y0AM48_9FLAO|nr:outer membrane beta-barrel protein [Chryseobacterium antibioticum]NML69836.1 PorT family protein [Chryseobacterium antibioticum]
MNNQWLNDLHRKMEDHEEDIPDGVWEDIKDELFSEEEEKGIAGAMMLGTDDDKKDITRPANGRRSILYHVGGIAAALAILFFTGKLLLEMNGEKIGSHIAKKSENAGDRNEKGRKITEPVSIDTRDKINTDANEKYSGVGNRVPDKISIDKVLQNRINKEINRTNLLLESIGRQEILAPLTAGNLPDHSSSSGNENSVLKEQKEVEEIFNQTENELHEKLADTNQPKIPGHQQKKWMLSMLTGNVSSNSSEQKFPGYASMSGSPMAFSDVWISGTENDPLTNLLLANQSKEVEARIRHKIPVTIGLSMYYNLGKRWGIGTGVNYTKLTSELHSGSNSNYIKGEQSVHYIGIPVQVNYKVIQKGRFTGYVTGGVVVEKAVTGKLKTKYIVNDEVQETQEERIDVKPVQFSVNSAVGLQVKIIDKLGIYAEPGIGYHFKNDGQLNTIYKEKPLNFNMKFGIRVLLD